MPKDDPELAALRDQLADAQAEIERLQAQAADAEARAATLQERLARAQAEIEALRRRIGELESQLQAGEAALAQRDQQLADLQDKLRQAGIRYREARLAASPEVPADLVTGEAIEEIDQQFEAALKLVSQVRHRLQEESQATRVPIGAPPRRAPDLSALSPAEKIRLGLANR